MHYRNINSTAITDTSPCQLSKIYIIFLKDTEKLSLKKWEQQIARLAITFNVATTNFKFVGHSWQRRKKIKKKKPSVPISFFLIYKQSVLFYLQKTWKECQPLQKFQTLNLKDSKPRFSRNVAAMNSEVSEMSVTKLRRQLKGLFCPQTTSFILEVWGDICLVSTLFSSPIWLLLTAALFSSVSCFLDMIRKDYPDLREK